MGIREHIKKRIITLESLIEPECFGVCVCVVETIMIRKMWIAFAHGVCHMFGVCNDPISFSSFPSDSQHSIQSLDDGGVFCLVWFNSVLSSVCSKSMFNLIRRNNTAHAARHEGLEKKFHPSAVAAAGCWVLFLLCVIIMPSTGLIIAAMLDVLCTTPRMNLRLSLTLPNFIGSPKNEEKSVVSDDR